MRAAITSVGAARGEGIHDGGERCSSVPGAAIVNTPITAGISDGRVDGGDSHSALVEAMPMVIPAGSYRELDTYIGGGHGGDIGEEHGEGHGGEHGGHIGALQMPLWYSQRIQA